MKKTPLLLGLTAALVTASAAQYQEESLTEFASGYNQQSNEVPGFLTEIVGGETVNINVESRGNVSTVGVEFEGIRAVNTSEGGFSDPTLIVNVSKSAINSTLGSDNPYRRIEKAVEAGEISYRSTTVGGKIKIALLDAGRALAGFI